MYSENTLNLDFFRYQIPEYFRTTQNFAIISKPSRAFQNIPAYYKENQGHSRIFGKFTTKCSIGAQNTTIYYVYKPRMFWYWTFFKIGSPFYSREAFHTFYKPNKKLLNIRKLRKSAAISLKTRNAIFSNCCEMRKKLAHHSCSTLNDLQKVSVPLSDILQLLYH